MKKRAAIVILLAVTVFVFWRWKQATTVIVVEGVPASSIHGFLDPSKGPQYVDVIYRDTDSAGRQIAATYEKAVLTKLELLPDTPDTSGGMYTFRFTLEVPSAHANFLKGQSRVVIMLRKDQRSRFAAWVDDWLGRPDPDAIVGSKSSTGKLQKE
jgi:hypothetical protein